MIISRSWELGGSSLRIVSSTGCALSLRHSGTDWVPMSPSRHPIRLFAWLKLRMQA